MLISLTVSRAAEQFSEHPVRHLLVDLDGTLLGNHGIRLSLDFVRRAFYALRPYGGLRKTAQLLMSIQREFTAPASIEHTNEHRVVELFSKQMNLSIEEARTALRQGVLTIFPSLQQYFYPVEGAKEFLDWAKNFYPLTLATNPVCPPEIVDMRVKWAGIDPAIFGSMTHILKMHSCKPSPEYYEEILKEQGLRAEDCLLIGDNVKMDLPATRVGIRVFIVGKNSHLGSLRFTGAKAPAWRGSYSHLQALLENAQATVS